MNNNYHPELMYDIIDQRHADIRNAQANHRLANFAKDNRANHLQSLVDGIDSFTKRISSQDVNIDETQIALHKRQT